MKETDSSNDTATEETMPELAGTAKRHARPDLIPIPSSDPADPYNWPSWKKHALLLQVAFHAMMGPFLAAAVIPAFLAFAEDFNISITQASYFVSVQIIFLGTAPLFWAPVANRVGRRPVYLISTLGAAVCTFAGAYCHSYGTLMILRVLQSIMISPPQSIGSSSIKEMFFEHERGQKMGIWLMFVTLGPPIAPFIFGFVVQRTSWHWIFWAISIVHLLEFLLYFFCGPETLFDRPLPEENQRDSKSPKPRLGSSLDLEKYTTPTATKTQAKALRQQYLSFPRLGKAPWSHVPIEIVKPLAMFARLPVFLPSLAYTIFFTYSNVLLTVEIPALLGVEYHLDPQAMGLQFIAPILGCMLGEPIAGYGSDRFMAWRRRQGKREPEARLWLGMPGFLLGIVGLVVFGVQLQNTRAAGRWNVTPDIGTAITFFGLQLVSTVAVTYAVESQTSDRGQDAALFIGWFRQTVAFTGPFYFNKQYAAMGPARASGLLAGLVGGASTLIVATIIFGKRWRGA
ncbi:hypothetical protein FRB94_008715 [Tulasnella sp. JGI-2019a]|nr:hypothetical protein FRB94_008715 [Tulasnella sp. JGI-2019a]KAG8997469.1 hypothetical protein FRB93_014080 [Tulasnella sp. JGI-2019a]